MHKEQRKGSSEHHGQGAMSAFAGTRESHSKAPKPRESVPRPARIVRQHAESGTGGQGHIIELLGAWRNQHLEEAPKHGFKASKTRSLPGFGTG